MIDVILNNILFLKFHPQFTPSTLKISIIYKKKRKIYLKNGPFFNQWTNKNPIDFLLGEIEEKQKKCTTRTLPI